MNICLMITKLDTVVARKSGLFIYICNLLNLTPVGHVSQQTKTKGMEVKDKNIKNQTVVNPKSLLFPLCKRISQKEKCYVWLDYVN